MRSFGLASAALTAASLIGCGGTDFSLPLEPARATPDLAGTGTVRVIASTVGAVPLGPPWIDWIVGDWMTPIAPDGITEVALRAGDYWPTVGSAHNCFVTSPSLGKVKVEADEAIDIHVTIECMERGNIEVLVSATGDEVPERLNIRFATYAPMRRSELRTISTNDTSPLVMLVGAWLVGPELPLNCSVDGERVLNVTVTETDVPRLEFAVSCVRHSGTLRLVATMNGAYPMRSLSFGIDAACSIVDDWGCGPMSDDGVVTMSLPPGSHQVGVIAPGGCTVRPSV